MGPIAHFLGMQIQRNRLHLIVILDQEEYVNLILRRFHMKAEKGVSTPMEPGTITFGTKMAHQPYTQNPSILSIFTSMKMKNKKLIKRNTRRLSAA